MKSIIDKILTDERWDMKFIGMQIVIEGLALSAFATARETTPDPVLKDVVYLVTRDEARHVTFGVNYLEEFIKTLSDEEREERAQFAYEACAISRERLVATDVFRHFGWDVEEARKKVLDGFVMSTFRNLLFQRVIPNLGRIGLLTEKVRPSLNHWVSWIMKIWPPMVISTGQYWSARWIPKKRSPMSRACWLRLPRSMRKRPGPALLPK